MLKIRYIASCNFGKDSLSAIICRLEHGESVDEAVYCRVMSDDTISAEYPEHEDWIHSKAIPLLKSRYGISTTIVQSEMTYWGQFYTKYVRSKNKQGQYYGFPMLRGPWCNSRLKIRPIEKWQKTAGEYKSIVGIAVDEKKRQTRSTVIGKILPLVEYGITEAEAFEICRRAGLLSPAYNGGRQRLGCWFCHNQLIGELLRLRREHPYLWGRLLEMEKDSFRTFKPSATLSDFEERFRNEEAQIVIPDYPVSRLCA
jgi:3'-phosphoadenosine 5'-phosphosulfate sulfotransferase (PAPS reductase)/FAD synthetase